MIRFVYWNEEINKLRLESLGTFAKIIQVFGMIHT